MIINEYSLDIECPKSFNRTSFGLCLNRKTIMNGKDIYRYSRWVWLSNSVLRSSVKTYILKGVTDVGLLMILEVEITNRFERETKG